MAKNVLNAYNNRGELTQKISKALASDHKGFTDRVLNTTMSQVSSYQPLRPQLPVSNIIQNVPPSKTYLGVDKDALKTVLCPLALDRNHYKRLP